MRRIQKGFTLVEMIVAMAATSLVVFAGMSFVLFCLRWQSRAYAGTSRENSARVAISLIEELVSGEHIKVTARGRNVTFGADDAHDAALVYDANAEEIRVSNGTVLMNDVTLAVNANGSIFAAELTDHADGEVYSTTICRRQGGLLMLPEKEEIFSSGASLTPEESARYDLLTEAAKQCGKDGTEFYTWYCGGAPADEGWKTAWCGCFVSWCADAAGEKLGSVLKFADVGTTWDALAAGSGVIGAVKADAADVSPGDLVFFDLHADDDRADHVAIVMKIEDGTLYTIEGNHDGKVKMWDYSLEKDAEHILGFARLDWKSAG